MATKNNKETKNVTNNAAKVVATEVAPVVLEKVEAPIIAVIEEVDETSAKTENVKPKKTSKKSEAKVKKEVKTTKAKKDKKTEKVKEAKSTKTEKPKAKKAEKKTKEKISKVEKPIAKETEKVAPKAKKTTKTEKAVESIMPPTLDVTIQPTEKKYRDGSIGTLIMKAAENKYPYRNEKGLTMIDNKTRKKLTDEEYEKVAKHRDICRELVRLSVEHHNFPYGVLVYLAVGSDAHKKPVFEKGYKQINVERAETILKWLEAFARYNENPKFYTSDKIAHAFAKFYDTFSKKDKDFNKGMKAFTKQPMIMGYKANQYKSMEQFYQLFFKPFTACIEVNEDTNEERVVSVSMKPQNRRGRKPKNVAKAS